eukprot:TRINITY_DN33709_c0_g1_i1.p2 TRINITY_DN33709_c0_g1~~TRINITY_DN33709_c0_g1_i1.p2  ORF type:complete len:106 (+),score=39.60 TRINITY_DN33709_c0_g1_i1:87-404(+)
MLIDLFCFVFFFQAEDGIRDVERSRGLGDVYKRQNAEYMGNNAQALTDPEAKKEIANNADNYENELKDISQDKDMGMLQNLNDRISKDLISNVPKTDIVLSLIHI